jgi:uncharacterized protein YndB with AHSA1/START domain
MTDEGTGVGELDLSGERPMIRYRRVLAHPPEKVWRALTEPEHLTHWFPTTIDCGRAAGASLAFRFETIDIEPMLGEMLAYDPPRLMEFSWGEDVMRFELTPHPSGCLLVVSDTIVELGKAARDGAGWQVCLEHLERVLKGGPPTGDPEGDRWRQVHPGYVRRFGPAASVLGPPPEWEEVHGPA